MKQNYTKQVYFSFSNPLPTANSPGEPTISSAGELDSGKLTFRRNDRNCLVEQGL